jgi:Alw26I/Eco31I/Esp3I family type II restriction m6 adenine DNA methyltransferase
MVIPRINSTSLKLLDKLHTYSRLRSIPQLEVRRGELDLTINKTLITPKKTNNPLIRGSHISRFRLIESRHKPEYVKMSKFRDILKTSNRGMHLEKNRIACQQISNMSQRWRLKFAPIPPGTVLANSCNYVALHNDEKYLNFYLGLLNSELINWRFQISNFNNHVSIRELQALPIIQPTFDSTLSKNLQQTVENLDYPSIEANVFALYGFNSREARIILNQRNTPLHERKQILARLEELAF